jgi:hypothetical protein
MKNGAVSARKVFMPQFFRVAVLGLALAGGSLVASCGDNEPAERKAFIAFLQTYVLDKPGVHLPKPTEADIKSFGGYASHYAVITNFAADPEMMAIGQQMAQAIQTGAPRSVQEVMSRQQDVRTVRDSLAKFRVPLEQKFAAAEAARDALKQPVDLKAVFAAAFDRDVGDPARAFRGALPVVDDALESVLKLAAYIDAHRKEVTISGTNIEVKNPKVRSEVNALLQGITAKAQQLQEHQRRLRVVLTGR